MFAPVYDEITSWYLPVTGAVPAELDGVFLRNGPNPPPVAYEGTYHWFVPDGIVHGVKLHGGRPARAVVPAPQQVLGCRMLER